MEQAIKKAIEGGYKMLWDKGLRSAYPFAAFIDPLFWQALGKALGWGIKKIDNKKKCPECGGLGMTATPDGEQHDCFNCGNRGKITIQVDQKVGRDGYINAWQSYWHDFIDHLAEGKDADSFFNELLK